MLARVVLHDVVEPQDSRKPLRLRRSLNRRPGRRSRNMSRTATCDACHPSAPASVRPAVRPVRSDLTASPHQLIASPRPWRRTKKKTECPSPKRRTVGPETLTVRDFEMHVTDGQLRILSFDYYILGLVDESGEVIEASKKKVAATVRCDVASELGDVLWYTTALRLSLEDARPWYAETSATRLLGPV